MSDPVAAMPSQATIDAPSQKLSVALTGTSNCIFVNGISFGMGKHSRVERFVNKSLGASGTVAIAAHLQDFDLSGIHYVFIEYCINESIYLAQGTETIDNTYRHIAAMVDHAARAGCVPVLVNLPTIRALGRASPMFEMMKREFVTRGVGVFDVQHLLETWIRERQLDPVQCFFDQRHLKRPIAFALGTIMINTLERARAAQAISAFADLTTARYGGIGFIPAQDLVLQDATRLRRSNRLLETDLLVLAPGNSAAVPAPNSGTQIIRGLAYNAARSIGLLTTAQGDVMIDLGRRDLFGIKKDLSLAIVPLPMPGVAFSDTLQLSYAGAKALPADTSPIAFELAGLTVHDLERDRPLHVIQIAPESRQLHHTLDAADWAILNAAWDQTLTD